MKISKTSYTYQPKIANLFHSRQSIRMVSSPSFSAYQPERWATLNAYIKNRQPTVKEYIPHLFEVSPYAKLYHNKELILEAISKYGYDQKPIIQHLGDGKQTLALELEDGVALRVMNTPPSRKRINGLDLPVWDNRDIALSTGRLWIECQPIADIDVTEAEQTSFLEKLRKKGLYPLQDFFTKGQIGRYQGEIYLIDPDCVVEMNFKNAKEIVIAATCHKIARLFACNTIYETPLYTGYRRFRLKQLKSK